MSREVVLHVRPVPRIWTSQIAPDEAALPGAPSNGLTFNRSRLVALEEVPEEPIKSYGPGVHRPGPRIYSPGRTRGPKAPESARENISGGRVDRFPPGRIYPGAGRIYPGGLMYAQF